MEVINAIAKARFASAKAQCVPLHKSGSQQTELLCMEPGQELKVSRGRWLYYVVKGRARVVAGDCDQELAAGQIAAAADGERHSVHNAGEQRLVCLAVGWS